MQGAATVAPDSVPGMLPIPVTKTHIYGIAQPNRRLGMRTPEQANSFVWQLMGPSHGLLGLGKLTQELGQVVEWSSGQVVAGQQETSFRPKSRTWNWPVGILTGMSHVVARPWKEDTVSFTLFYIAHPRLHRCMRSPCERMTSHDQLHKY